MAKVHRVEPGDHISSIAEAAGFASWSTIWNHPANAALRARRPNPHVLEPGDQVTIPDKAQKTEPAPTGARKVFVVQARPLRLRIRLHDFDDQPFAGVKGELTVAGKRTAVTADGKGVVEAVIPRTARSGVLALPALGLTIPLQIGFLDPVEGQRGGRQRLINLGYWVGPLDSDDALTLRWAVEEFQVDHELRVTGELDDGTLAKLKTAHGS